MSNVLMIIAPERFRDEELFVTKAELEKAGHTITIASIKKGVCLGSRGGFAEATIALSDVQPKIFNAVVVVGGGGAKLYFENQQVAEIVKEMNQSQKIVAAICLAPVILANAGILNGRKATVAGTEAKTIENKGAIYTGPGVEVDGNIVTANGPKSSFVFGQKINELLNLV